MVVSLGPPPQHNYLRKQLSDDIERLPMDNDEICTSNSQRGKLGLAGNDSPIHRANSQLNRSQQAISSKKVTVLCESPSQSAMEVYAPQLPNNSKVAIPRESSTQILRSKGRVSRACDTCRGQKAKCSGQRPACQRCRQSDMTCIYSDTKGDRDAKQFADLTSRTQIYEGLLRNLHPYLDRQLATQVEKVIDGLPVTSPMTLSPSPVKNAQEATNNPIQPNDHTVEDHTRDRISQATGFVGRPSEVAWLHNLKMGPNLRSEIARPLGQSGFLSPLSTNYFLDDNQILAPNPSDYSDCPSKNAATQLVECYFQNVHASFPIISKLLFLEQFRRFYANPDPQLGRKWIAILNMIFAIASRHSSLVRKQPRSDLPYFTRAWELYTRDFAVLEHPSLQQVQIESLITLYLLSYHLVTAFTRPKLIVNRAWRMCGIALRSAVAMEIHLRTENGDFSSISKETRYRLWWALYSLDVQMCLMTGRPLNMDLGNCTTPLPVPYPEEDFLDKRVAQVIADEDIRTATVAPFASCAIKSDSGVQRRLPHSHYSAATEGHEKNPDDTFTPDSIVPNTSLYFLCCVSLACIGRSAMDEIHSPKAASLPWDEVEMSIARNNAYVDDWLARLPSQYNFDKSSPIIPFVRQRTSLAFRFYSFKLIILEPCLRRVIGILTEGSCSARCQIMAAICMQVARSVLNLLPDEPDIAWLYEYCPWWSIVHYIMQSSTILMISLAGQVELGFARVEESSCYIKKACRWLQEMSRTDEFSRRAWNIFHEIAACHIPDLVRLSNASS
ncbi:hypothetical protein N7454_005243 [Penicillium verhagenii]|nr:hypothetical protein N7454_005243 [Penicillium verhagenii]